MAPQLETLLESLHSDNNRLTFLRKLYTPGNIEVADYILSLEQDSNILEAEIEHARKQGANERATTLTKRYVDYCVEHGYDSLLEGLVRKFGDPVVAEYAISQLTSKLKGESALQNAADIAKAFGKDEEARKLLEKTLELQIRHERKYPYIPANTCVKLGRYSQAIDLYSEGDYYDLGKALQIARENVPDKLKQIAQRLFEEYNPSYDQNIFFEAAEVLGKIEEARKILVNETRKLKSDRSPRFYKSLVSVLVKLGEHKAAEDLVNKVAGYEYDKMRKKDYYDLDNQKELADLFGIVGDKAAAEEAYLVRIDKGLNEGWHPSNIITDIERGYEVTGDKIFLEKKLLLLENQQEYLKAAEMATQLENFQLAEAYKSMHQLMETVKTKSNK